MVCYVAKQNTLLVPNCGLTNRLNPEISNPENTVAYRMMVELLKLKCWYKKVILTNYIYRYALVMP